MAYSRFLEKCVYDREGSPIQERVHTAASLRDLLITEAQAGEHIRVDYVHSLTFISADNTGFYVMDYGGDGTQKILLNHFTYEEFISKYSGNTTWLHNANTAKNDSLGSQNHGGDDSPGKHGPHHQFSDVLSDNPCHDAVMFVFSEGLMLGVNDSSFAPTTTLTREQSITIIARLSGDAYLKYAGQSSFVDVASSRWSAAAIAWARDCGITMGIGDNIFDPTGKVSVDQFEIMLIRHLGLNEVWTGNSSTCTRADAAILLYDYLS